MTSNLGDISTSKRLVSQIISHLTIDTNKQKNTTGFRRDGTENDPRDGCPFYAQRSSPHTVASPTDDESSFIIHDAVFFNANPIFATSDDPNSEFGLPGIYSIQHLKKKLVHILENQYLSCTSDCSRKQDQIRFSVGNRGRVSRSDISVLLGIKDSDSQIFCDLISTGLQSTGARERDAVCRVFNPHRREYEYALMHVLQSHLVEFIAWRMGGYKTSTNITVKREDDHLTVAKMDEILWSPTLEDLSQPVGNMGIMTSAELAREMELTHDDVSYLLDQLSENTANASFDFELLTAENGLDTGNIKVIQQHKREHLEQQVINALSGVSIPTALHSIFPNESISILIPIVEALCKNGYLHGSLSTYKSSITSKNDVSTSGNATFTPHIYTYTQRNYVNSLFRTHGYLTEREWISLGLSRNRIEAFVKEAYPGAVLLRKCIFEPDHICSPLVDSVQSAISNKSFVDLRSLLPDDIATNSNDVEEIIHQHLGISLSAQQSTYDDFLKGQIVVGENIGIFFSHDMTEHSRKLLVSMVPEFGKRRANEIVKMSSGTASSNAVTCETLSFVPLLDVADSIAIHYPDLLERQKQFEEIHSLVITKNPSTTDLNWDDGLSDGPLIAFCRTLFSDEIQNSCMRIINAEVSRHYDTRGGISVSAHTAGATEMKDTELAFEHSFKDMCYLLQVLQKSLETLIQRYTGIAGTVVLDENHLTNKLRKELLEGCGSVLATKIVQYAAFKTGVDIDGDECLLSFNCRDKGFPETCKPVPQFYDAVDMSTLSFPTISLSCRPDENGYDCDPLKYLQSMFPGNQGIALANTWRICTQFCGDSSNEKDNLDEFLSHLKENCLLAVGIPFPILDKKSEKRIFAERRQALLRKLESSENDEIIWMAAAVLIYQQVRNVSVAGKLSIRVVLNELENEKKIPHTVCEAIKKLSEAPSSADLSLRRTVSLMASAKNSKALAIIASELSN